MMLRFVLGLVVIVGAAMIRPSTHAARPLNPEEAKDLVLSLDNRAMDHLDQLVNGIGSRPVGTPNFLRSCKWALDRFTEFGLSRPHLEQCGTYAGEFPAGADGAYFRSLYASTPGNDAAGGQVPVYNVVADIPGTEFPDEYVIVGAHLDGAPQGPGATDNGAGVAAVMEAARLLATVNAQPRRTIRFVLFGGEEAGLLGSRGYLAAHPDLTPKISAVFNMDHGAAPVAGVDATEPLYADLTRAFASAGALDADLPFTVKKVDYLPTVDPDCCAALASGGEGAACGGAPNAKADGAGCGGTIVLNTKPGEDGLTGITTSVTGEGCGASSGCAAGAGARVIKGVNADGDSVVQVVMIPGAPGADSEPDLEGLDLEAYGISAAQLAAGGKTMRRIAVGSSDHAPFLAAGIPAFWFAQETGGAFPYPAHSAQDTYDVVKPRYLEHSARVIALGALGTANLDHLLSRERLTDPAQASAAASVSSQ